MDEPKGRILFTSGVDADTDLWCLDVGAGRLTQLTRGSARNGQGCWSPDGERIAYVSNEAGASDLSCAARTVTRAITTSSGSSTSARSAGSV